ncbi:TRAP transporter substrate-binding protein [Elioraea sp.]|uniref:TRAP transporter substrate-binding protein n=1 Tax=Elioraea sp. TaxID=2185103 RepID=UPI003F71BA91
MIQRRSLLVGSTLLATPFVARAQAAVSLRLHTLVTSPHPYNAAADWFGEEIAKRTNGAVRSTLFPSAQLGPDRAVLDEMRLGTIDLMISTTNNAAAQVPQYNVFSLGYLIPDYDAFRRAMRADGPIAARVQALYEERRTGLMLLGFMMGGTRNLSAVRPVRTLDDLKGLKMRVPPSPAVARQWQALGTLPVTINWAEVYTSIQTGVAQALESSLSGYIAERFYEVAPHLSLTMHEVQVGHFTMSARSLAKIPEAHRATFRATAAEAMEVGTRAGIEADEGVVRRARTEFAGRITVHEPDRAAFARTLAPLQDELAQSYNARDLLDMVRAAVRTA